jgi:hypothetical protein
VLRRALFLAIVTVSAGCSASQFADAGRDLGVDAGPEMGVDASADLATDSEPYDAGPCPESFYTMRPAFDRSCTTDADCAVGIYFAGCCGPTGSRSRSADSGATWLPVYVTEAGLPQPPALCEAQAALRRSRRQ